MSIAGLRQITTKVAIAGNGDSPILDLPRGVLVLYVSCPAWAGATAQLFLTRDGIEYPALDGNNDIIMFSENKAVPVLGGQRYFLRVSGNSSVLTADAVQSSREK